MITNPYSDSNPEFSTNCDLDVSKFIRFLKHIRLKELLSKIPDTRQQSKVTYTNHSILLWALSVFFFRQGSKNAFNSSLKSLKQKNSLLRYLEIEGESLPHQNTVDEYLATIDPNQINVLLMDFFKACLKNKLFYNHAGTLLPENRFHLGVDGFWVHHYNKPHATNLEGHNNCPYCLPRVHKKGTPEQYTNWVHVFVTFVMIFPGGLTLPIYFYPLKSEQVNTSASNEDLKQECELIAAHFVLPKIREQLPRIPITFLGDGLYANQPFLKLCNHLGFDYAIVFPEKCLPKIRQHCRELAQTTTYKNYRTQTSEKTKTQELKREFEWFNNIYLGSDTYTNILRLKEECRDINGKVYIYKNEWLVRDKMKAGKCDRQAKRGRLRWHQEDLHNTTKNRGFAAEHDYARTNPTLWLIWKLLMMLAFSIFELFSHTRSALEAKGARSWKRFATSLLEQLLNVSWKNICASKHIQNLKIQFRYVFDSS